MNVVCFGDSNTYGFDPRSYFGDRYDADWRWVDILAEKSGWNIKNQGMNGRGIPRGTISIPDDTELFIVMLGTNDLLQGIAVDVVSKQMEQFIRGLKIVKLKLFLIAPPPMQLGEWVPNRQLIEESVRLGQCYREIADRLCIGFADAGEWMIPMAYDGVHFTEEGHRRFANRLWKEFNK